MKLFLLLMILFISFTRICGQTANEQALKKTIETLLLSMKKNDAGAASNLLADNYKMDGHAGIKCITNKAERLASIQAGKIKYEPIDFENKANHLHIMTDTTAAAIFTQIAIAYKTCEAPAKEYTTRTCALLFVKKEEHWLLSSECIGTNCIR